MEADEHERDSAPSFASWLDVMAPSYARLYLRRGSPLWYAVHDLRAAMILDSEREAAHMNWTFYESMVWDQASSTLESSGLVMPEALFRRVERIAREGAGVPLPEVDDPPGKVHQEESWARRWLFDAARDALRLGPEAVSRRRYGCDPDAPPRR